MNLIHRAPWTLFAAFSALVLLPPHVAFADAPTADPARFDREVAAIEAHDAATPPQKDGIVFIGSSNVRKWPLAEAFPGLPVINHGFGGSHVSDSVFFFDRLVTPYRPKLVVLHAGGNDLAAVRSPAQIAADIGAFVTKLHAALPEARLVCVGLIPAPVRSGLMDQFHATTRLIKQVIRRDKRVIFVDPEKPLLAADGSIRPELYIEDHLHLNNAGYAILTKAAAPAVRRAFNR